MRVIVQIKHRHAHGNVHALSTVYVHDLCAVSASQCKA